MAIQVNNGVTNVKGTPGAITDSIGNQPSALDIANGTIYIAPDVPAIYTNDNGTWKLLSGGGGGGGLLTADNGLTANSSTNVQLGGTLIKTTLIDVDDNIFQIKNAFTSIIYTDSNNLVGINTVTPLFKLDVDGEIRSNTGVRISVNPSKTGIYPYDPYGGGLDFYTASNRIATFRLTNPGGQFYIFDASHIYDDSLPELSTASMVIKGSVIPKGINDVPIIQLLINPSYDQTPSGNLWGTGTLRGIYYNPTIASLNTSTHIAIETTSGDILLDNFNLLNVTGNNSQVFKIDTSTIDLYSGASGLNINASLGVTTIGDTTSFGSGTNIQIFDTSGLIQTIYFGAVNGLYIGIVQGEYKIGGFWGGSNLTYIEIDDYNQFMNFRNAAGRYNYNNMPSYADNSAALAAGLVVGDLYRHDGLLESQDQLRIVH